MADQKVIDIQQQPNLGFLRTARIAMAGVRYRLFRSAVTVVVIGIAMAFLTNILSESLIKSATAESAREGIEQLREVDGWIARLSVPQSPDEAIREIAGTLAEVGPEGVDRVLTSWPPEKITPQLPVVAQAQRYLAFFDSLNYGRKRMLVGNEVGANIFDRLQDPAKQEAFFETLHNQRSIRFVSTDEEFRTFLEQWPSLSEWLRDIRQQQSQAIARVDAQADDRSILERLGDADGAFGTVLREAGFHLPPEEAIGLAARARATQQSVDIDSTVNLMQVRQRIAASKDILPSDVTVDLLWSYLLDPDEASAFLAGLAERDLSIPGLDAAILQQLAERKDRERLLNRAERATLDAGGGFLGLGKRMTWLAFVSMLVCVVGIANAMLMSVTERFREIATLKCLGALDGFIMTVFLIEASMLGLAGGVFGALTGALLGTGRMFLQFRSLMLESLPVASLLTAMGISVVMGVVLAALAAVYPSFRAAQLAPMEAMRIE